MNTQLSSSDNYNVDKMVFSKAIKGSSKSKDGEPQIKFSRIMINTQNDDGSIGELIFPTTRLFSFGVSTNTNPDTGMVNGYTLPLCLWNKDGASPQEKAFSNKLEEIVEKCKDHLLLDSTKDETEKYDLERVELKKLNSFIYWKRDKGKIVEGTGPTLYPKLIESKKEGRIKTPFFDQDGNDIDPMKLIGKYCWVNAAIKIESIFIGAKIALQIKVYEAEVQLIDFGVKRLLPRPKAQSRVEVSSGTILPISNASQNPSANIEEDDDDDDEKIEDTPAQPPKPATPEPTKPEPAPERKPVRRVVKK
jgi:hypothetical protein